MAVIDNPRPKTRKELERDLAQTEKALRQARMAVIDPEPNVAELARERDRLEEALNDVRRERFRLYDLARQLDRHRPPIASDVEPELRQAIRDAREQHEVLEADLEEAERLATRALRRYNDAVAEHTERRRRVSLLEQQILSLQRELERAEPRMPRIGSWRDLIQTKT